MDRAIFDGGTLTPSGVSLQVTVAPFIASGFDGMVAVSDATESRSIPAPAAAGPDRISYLVLHLEYRSLTSPISNLQVIPETTWLTSVSRNFFVTFAKFTIPFGATSMSDPGVVIDYSMGDWADKLGKTGWRSPVATFASLPVVGNRDGDTRIAFDTRLAYAWNASTKLWIPVGNAVNLAEVASREAESRQQFHRATSGSGLLNEIPQSIDFVPGSTVAGDAVKNTLFQEVPVAVPFLPNPGVANTGAFPGCHFLMNGHFVKTHAANVTFAAPPGVGERFDLVILEVWRSTVSIPANETYKDEGGTPRAFTVLRNALETLQEQGGGLTASYDFSEMMAYDSTTFVATRYQFKAIANVNISALTDTATVAGAVTNVDGNAFSVGTNTDQKLWQATAGVSSVDGVSWAIPLVVVRRTSAELAGPPFIDTFRSNQRYVFDVCPRAELGMGLFEVEEAIKRQALSSAAVQSQEKPSGFISGTSDDLVPHNGSITVPAFLAQVRGRRLALGSAAGVSLPAPPATGGRTDLIVFEVLQTIFPPGDALVDVTQTELQLRGRMGPRAAQWVGRFRVFSLPLNVLQTTVDGAMLATTLYSTVAADPALWQRSSDPTVGEDPLFAVYALPICLIHRRNTGAYAVTLTGQNGADRSAFPGLLNQAATFPYLGEILDLRSRSVEDPDELQALLDESFDRLMAGDLRTNMATHTVASGVTGTQLLHVDVLGNAPIAGTNLIPNPPNSRQSVWSESDEAELFAWSIKDLTNNANDGTGTFAWTAGTNTLAINLPLGYTLSLDPQTNFNPYGPQGFIAYSVETAGGDLRPFPMVHSYFSGATPPTWPIVGDPVTPTPMNKTEVVLTLDGSLGYAPAGATAIIGVWAVRRNHEAGLSSAFNSYAQNRGLFTIPDTVRRIEYSLTGVAPFQRAWVGVPLNIIDVPVVGDALVIDQATLFASGSISSQLASVAGNLQSFAVADITLSSTSVIDKLRYIQFTDSTAVMPDFERCRIEFNPGSVPGGTTARVTLMCLGDLVDHWFEVDPGSKQIRGPYTLNPSQFSVTTSATHQTAAKQGVCGWSDCGISVLGSVQTGSQSNVGGKLAIGFPAFTGEFSFYAAGTLNAAWEIWFSAADRLSTRNISLGQSVGFQRGVDISGAPGTLMNLGAYSSMYSVNYTYTAGAFGAHSAIVLSPVRDPLPVGSVTRIYYEYTPYQGITTSLETKINGTVEGITDQIVFTNGPNKPWIDYRLLGTGLRRASQSAFPPGLYSGFNASGMDIGLLYSKGRVDDRNAFQTSDGPTYGGYYAVEDRAKPFRQADRPPLAISQRLPYPTKAPNGTNPSRYAPESFLSHSVLLDRPAIRVLPPGQAYPKSEVSPWLLEYSATSTSERVWRSQSANKTLYYPLPVQAGEAIVGLTMEVESAGPNGVVLVTFVVRDRNTGAISTGLYDTANFIVQSPGGTRLLHEVSIPSVGVASDPRNELLLSVVCSTSNMRVGYITLSVVPATTFSAETQQTMRRYPYNDARSGNPGKALRKGSKIAIPSSWTTEFAAYAAASTQLGRQDSPLSPSRGRTLLGTVLGTASYGAGGMIGYVPPGSDVSLGMSVLDGVTSAPGFAGRETPPRFNAKNRSVMTGATAPDTAAGTALAYIVRSSTSATYMGVSTGYTVIVNGTATLRVGQAVDAFYPVGRPVFRRS